MELTLDQALQKGIEAHKAGKVEEADRYYTAILKAQPKHPDANHNMGVLAVGVGKLQEALPFFKVALEGNASNAQYWLSYIDALIKLDRMADAKAVFEQAKSKGATGDGFDQIEKRLGLSKQTGAVENSNVQNPPKGQLQVLINLYTQGQHQEALDGASKLLKEFPNSVILYNIIGTVNQGLGKLEEAVEAYKRAIDIKPDYADAYNNLGLVLKDQGKLDEALEAFKKALALKPDTAEAHNNLGNTLSDQGKLGEAVEAYKKAISLKPNIAEVHNNLGNAFKGHGKFEEAIVAYNKALSIKPNFLEAHNNMGNVFKDTGKLEEAIEAFNKALSINPNFAEAYNNLGNSLRDQGKLKEAILAFNRALSIKPNLAEAYSNLGNTLRDQDKLDEAIEAYNKALSIKPDYAEVNNNLGNAFRDQGKLEESVEAFYKAISLKPNYYLAYNNLGNAFRDQGKLEEAIEAYNKALSIEPDYHVAYNNLGTILKDQGKLDEALASYERAVTIKPYFSEAHRHLSSMKRYTPSDPHFIQVKKIYSGEILDQASKSNLCFALAKMYEDIGELDSAFKYLSEGNALRKKLLKYSIDKDEELFVYFKTTQPNLLKNKLRASKSYNEQLPIFIIGMPRSGTTLVEQIISSHSKVTGAGELKYISRYGLQLAVGSSSINAKVLEEFREKYLAELSKVSNGNYFITDKLPQNFCFIPLICAAFPEAKIVHVQRDPRAICWSNYKQYFVSNGLGFSYDLQDLVSYYRLYTDLMQRWQSDYSDRIYNLKYEKLTTDQDDETRKLVKYLDLEWEGACLLPQKNKRSVNTASQQQVRQKIYQGSSEAWRKYELFLEGKFDNLPSL